MVSAKFTQKNFQRRPAAGLAKHWFDRIRLFSLNVLVYIRLVNERAACKSGSTRHSGLSVSSTTRHSDRPVIVAFFNLQ